MFINTARDLTVIKKGSEYSFIACDSLGGIGNKSHDSLKMSPRISGKYTIRVCLNEVYSVGAKPICVISTVSNEWDNTGKEVFEGIKEELNLYSCDIPAINGSTEENFKTEMTAFGITVISETENPVWRGSKENYGVYLIGEPFVGEEVIKNEYRNLKPSIIQDIMKYHRVGDFLPCGSKGINKELEVLCGETSLNFEKVYTDRKVNFTKSAGPSTCGIFTTDDESIDKLFPDIMLIGYLRK